MGADGDAAREDEEGSKGGVVDGGHVEEEQEQEQEEGEGEQSDAADA